MRALVAGLVAVALGVCLGCGGGGSTPTTPTPTPTPTPTITYQVTGTVTSAQSGPLSGATVSIVDGPFAGRSATTSSSGAYSITVDSNAGFTMKATAGGHVEMSKPVTLTQSAPTQTVNYTLLPSQIWSRSGTGDTVFDMPKYISRVRITGNYDSNGSNFIVDIGGRNVVNVIIGTSSWCDARYHDGTYLTSGGVDEITHSTGVRWTFTEVR